jgi:hypothetical protein
MTPDSQSNAATPPMGNPYPEWMSGMAIEALTMPGRQATFRTWWIASFSIRPIMAGSL